MNNAQSCTVESAERGAVLILFAFAVAGLIAMIALAIDTSLFASQHSKYDRTAEHSALAALEAYLEEINVSGDEQHALELAAARASELAEMNLSVHLTTALRSDTAQPLSKLGANVQDENGAVIPGRWHFVDSPEAAGCDAPVVPFRPCFQSLAPTQRANAMRVELKVHDNSPLKVMFSGFVPGLHRTFTAHAVASLVPRRAVFLLDLSPSIVRDTHVNNSSPGVNSEYAFYVDPIAAGCSAGWAATLESSQQNIFNALGLNRPGGAFEPKMHYRSEFQCFTVPAVTESFALDTVVPPEPLSGVLSAIHTSMSVFSERGVTADRFGLAGFDDEILPTRRLPMTVPDLSEPDYNDFFIATDQSRPIAERVSKFLFPRFFGGRVVTIGPDMFRIPAQTDIANALRAAENMIADEQNFDYADNFVVLISDGLSNCSPDPITATKRRCIYDPTDPALSETNVRAGVDELLQVADELQQFKIKLHVLLIGKSVGPHTLVLKDDTRCLSDESARSNEPDIQYTKYEGGSLAAGGGPFYYPNKIYDNVRQTGGLWVPIRDCCRDSAGQCTPAAEALLNRVCGAATVGRGEVVGCAQCAGADCPDFCRWVDASGRLTCDPKGRDQNSQVSDIIGVIMRDNPFLLVD